MSVGQMGVEPKGSGSGLLGIESFKKRRAAARAAQLSKVQKRRAAEAAQGQGQGGDGRKGSGWPLRF